MSTVKDFKPASVKVARSVSASIGLPPHSAVRRRSSVAGRSEAGRLIVEPAAHLGLVFEARQVSLCRETRG